jgi:hypothetical protein
MIEFLTHNVPLIEYLNKLRRYLRSVTCMLVNSDLLTLSHDIFKWCARETMCGTRITKSWQRDNQVVRTRYYVVATR